MADANLFQQYLKPVKSVQDYSNDMATAEANQLELAAKRQSLSDDAATRSAYQQSGGDQQNALERLIQNGQHKAAMALQKSIADNAHVKAQTEKQLSGAAKDNQDAKKTEQELKFAAAAHHAQGLEYVKTPQDVITYFDQGIAKGVFPAEMHDQMIAQANQYPTLEAWKQDERNASIPVLERFKTDAENSRNALTNKTSKDNNAATNARVAAEGAASRAQSERHFSATREDSKGQIVQTDNGPVLVNTRTGTGKVVSGPDGQPLPGITKPLNDSQSKSLLFGSRMLDAHQALNRLSTEGTNASVPGTGIPLIGNMLSSNNQQMLNQAKTNFMNAVLRRESGAAISSGEFASADKQYFPQVGDSQKVIAQKARNREMAINGVLVEVPKSQRDSLMQSSPADKTKSGATVSNW